MAVSERKVKEVKERKVKEVEVGGDRKGGDWAKFNKKWGGGRQYKGFFINYGG